MNTERLLAEYLDLGGQIEVVEGNLNVRAPKGTLSEALRESIRACKAELCALIGPDRRFCPISSQEQRLWFLHTQEGSGNAYNMDAAFRIEGPLDASALAAALKLIVQRHETLRTAYTVLDGKPYRAVMKACSPEPVFLDLPRLPREAAMKEAMIAGERFSGQSFDLTAPPLLRAQIIRVAPQTHFLFVVLHHIAADGASIQILVKELAEGYRAFVTDTAPDLPALTRSYSDCVTQNLVLFSQAIQGQLAYWAQELTGHPAQAELPITRQSGHEAEHRGKRYANDFPAPLGEQIRAWARQRECSAFSVLLAAFAAVLRRYASHDDILIGIASALRKQPDSEHLIGFFANTLPIRVDFSDDPSFDTLVKRVHAKVRAAQKHEDAPFEKIAGAARLRRQTGLTPLVHALFSMLKVEQLGFDAPGGVHFQRLRMERGTAKVPLAAVIATMGEGIRGALEYDSGLFEERTITGLWGHYQRLLEEGLNHPATRISALPMLSEAEREVILSAWNNTREEYPREYAVHQWFERQAAQQAESLAIVCAGRTLSYRELNDAAERLAALLRGRGAAAPSLVGVCLGRSAEMIVAQLAVLKAGAAYIALDPALPLARLSHMLEDARCRVVLTHPGEAEKYSEAGFDVVSVHLEALPGGNAAGENTPAVVGLNAPAYVVFTSGSTGRPKGVLVEHGGLLNLCSWFVRRFGITALDRMSCVFNPSFDALASEIWPCLMTGASLHLPGDEIRVSPEKLRDWLVESRITICSAPTVLAERLVALPWPAGTALRYLITGGDRLRKHPSAQLPFAFVNVYGPTENTVISTCYELPWPAPAEGAPPIGAPIANTQAYILDTHGNPVPAGVTGEIYLGGAQVARGYLHQPELTAERFRPNPYGEGRVYRTGDLGRYRNDGVIEYAGRCDTQVQLRGHRIEVEEIECCLQRIAAVSSAAVVMSRNKKGDARLTAYLVCAAELRAASLRAALLEELPAYMVPGGFVVLPELPVTANGKIDRQRLSENPPPGQVLALEEAERTAPRNPVEAQLARIWRELLDAPEPGVYDDFFALGGDSLLATQALSRIKKAFGVETPLSTFLAEPNIAAMASKVEAMMRGRDSSVAEGTMTPQPRRSGAHAPDLAQIEALSEEQLAKTLQELG